MSNMFPSLLLRFKFYKIRKKKFYKTTAKSIKMKLSTPGTFYVVKRLITTP
jgi:hypothetical protein